MRNRSLHATNAAGPPSKVDCPAALALPVTRCPGRVVESVPDTRSDLLSFGRIIARHRAAMLSAAFTSRHASEHRPGNTVANAVLDALAAHALASASEEPGNSRRFIDAPRVIALSSMGEKVFELGG